MASNKQRKTTCCDHTGLKQGLWTREEDEILFEFVTRNGHGKWRNLPKRAGLLRCGKSCRLRWLNYLSPNIKRGNFTEEEEETIINLHAQLGNKWAEIAAKLPGRTDNEIKNVWHQRLKKDIERNQNLRRIAFQSVGSSFGRLVVEQPQYPITAVHSPSETSSVVAAATASSSVNDLEMEEHSEPAVTSTSEISSEAGDHGGSEDTGNMSFVLDESFWRDCLWRVEEE